MTMKEFYRLAWASFGTEPNSGRGKMLLIERMGSVETPREDELSLPGSLPL